MTDEITTKKPLPVLIGGDYEHVMGQATITQTPDSTEITIKAVGLQGRVLGDFVAANEIVALSFAGVPVNPRKAHPKETK